MAIIDSYFKLKETVLPPANGSLSKVIPSSSIQLANQMVSKMIVDGEAIRVVVCHGYRTPGPTRNDSIGHASPHATYLSPHAKWAWHTVKLQIARKFLANST